MRIVDLRSDTLAMPTEEMLDSIKRAKLGDDVFRDDPTVIKLEEIAADKMGKEAALLVTSGTQGNLTSIVTHTNHGDEVILEAESHIINWEVAGLAAIAGVQAKTIKGNYGIMDPSDVQKAIRIKNIHCPLTKLICIENTHNNAGGVVLTPEDIQPIYDIAKSENIAVHTDGARIFNAAVALKIDVKQLTQYSDSVMFCLSKGLSSPIGSLICGEYTFIEKARKTRKMLGSGMRQAGIIAAPGIISLEKMIDRLKDDHTHAKLLAESLSKIDGIKIDLRHVQTNIVYFEVGDLDITPKQFIEQLESYHIRALSLGNRIRMVTHRGIQKNDIPYTIESIQEIAESSFK